MINTKKYGTGRYHILVDGESKALAKKRYYGRNVYGWVVIQGGKTILSDHTLKGVVAQFAKGLAKSNSPEV